jgi:peptidylprolyl isomerase
LSLGAFTGYNSSFKYSIVEENKLPQSRRRKRKGKGSARHTQTAGAGLSKRGKIIALVIVVALIVAGVIYLINISKSSSTTSTTSTSISGFENATTTASGLKYIDEVEGTGASPKIGQNVTVHYTGTLTNGTEFDSSRNKGQPYTFRLGVDPMIKGWDEGLMTMKIGGRRKLLVPPDLGYGARGRSPIPPNATLIFDMELLDAK